MFQDVREAPRMPLLAAFINKTVKNGESTPVGAFGVDLDIA
jgi:hypothetical protein